MHEKNLSQVSFIDVKNELQLLNIRGNTVIRLKNLFLFESTHVNNHYSLMTQFRLDQTNMMITAYFESFCIYLATLV